MAHFIHTEISCAESVIVWPLLSLITFVRLFKILYSFTLSAFSHQKYCNSYWTVWRGFYARWAFITRKLSTIIAEFKYRLSKHSKQYLSVNSCLQQLQCTRSQCTTSRINYRTTLITSPSLILRSPAFTIPYQMETDYSLFSLLPQNSNTVDFTMLCSLN
jgi:hypothetical protein